MDLHLPLDYDMNRKYEKMTADFLQDGTAVE